MCGNFWTQDPLDAFIEVITFSPFMEAVKALTPGLTKGQDFRKDRELMVNSSVTPRRIVYGRARVGSQLVFACTSGNKNQYLHIIVVFTGHAIDAFEEIWLDDHLHTDAIFTGKVSVALYDGTQTEADPNMIAASNGLWTTDHKLLGCAYGYFQFTYDDKAFPNGLPTIKAVLRGKKVLDPRTGFTAWSPNPALCAYDYMRLSVDQGGMGCGDDEILVDSIIAAANRCEEVVA